MSKDFSVFIEVACRSPPGESLLGLQNAHAAMGVQLGANNGSEEGKRTPPLHIQLYHCRMDHAVLVHYK